MTNKAYIVANEQQEREVLEQLEREGYVWRGLNTKPTIQPRLIDEPIPIFARDDKRLTFDYKVNEAYLADYEIVFDGRKEEKMADKYVVSQKFMNALEWWKKMCDLGADIDVNFGFVSYDDIENLPEIVSDWWCSLAGTTDSNNRLIAIIRWVNGEDVFEVEKSKKWIVRSKEVDSDGETAYVDLVDNVHAYVTNRLFIATRFDTKEEAQEWANSHQEVVEVVDV
ncbi:hypothetical protein [Weissella bombi]|uniref:hypothetical protein n=1 Tax=Weissella bombi TaxID=1505725 RepID=UPI003AF24E74